MSSTPSGGNVAGQPRRVEVGASVGIFLALLAAFTVYSRASTALLRYPDRAIGVGLVNGVDPARRFPIYLVMVATALGVWLACHYGARFLARRWPSWSSGVRSRLENDLCALFAAVGSVALVARISAGRLDRLGPMQLSLAALGATAAFAVARRLLPRASWFPRHAGSMSTVALIVLLAWPSAQVAAVLANAQGPERAWVVRLGTLLLPVLYALAFGYCLSRPGRAARPALARAFALGAAPLFLFPSLLPVANEVQHALAQRRVVEPRSVALGFLVVLVIAGGALFWAARRGKLRAAPGRLLARFVFPSIIFGEALISVHAHVLRAKSIDSLHDGEHITPIQQLLSFDKWPFVDIWPAHGLFDYIGALYSLVNGFHPLEISAWNGLMSALSALAVYAVLANVAPPLFAFAVAALLPIEAVMPMPIYSFFYAEPGLLAVGLLACLVLDRPSTGRYVLLSLAAYLCFFWTPTSGVASIAAVFGLLLLGLITASDRKPVWRGLAVFAVSGVGVFAAYALVLMSRGQPVFETFRLIRAFMQADPLVGGRANLMKDFDAPAFFQYLILPGIGLVYLARLARQAIERRPLNHAERLLAFLVLVSFVLFARTLTRHSIIERYQPFYFPLLALCALMPLRSGAPGGLLAMGAGQRSELAAHFWQRASARAWFCSGLALYLVWFPMPSHKHLVFEAYPFHTWQPKEERFQGDVPKYRELTAFLNKTLRPGDTFLELMNRPALYGLLGREVPGQFFLPTMFYATDGVQESVLARLEKFGGSARVPVVLTGGRAIDSIDNSLRSYRISEYVHREYVPFGEMDSFEVWLARSRWDEAAQKASPRPLALRDPSSYRSSSVDPPRLEGDVLRITATGKDPRVEDIADVAGVPLAGLDAYHAVRLSYRTNVAGPLELFYRVGGKYSAGNSGRATLALSPSGDWQSVEVAIPLSKDKKSTLEGLRIDPPDGATLEVKDVALVFGAPPPAAPEDWKAGMLPFFWGNFDEHHAAQNARVLQGIDVPANKAPLKSLALRFPPVADKGTGNYLKLCIRLPGYAPPSKASPWATVHHTGSWQAAGEITLRYGSPASSFIFSLVQPTPGVPGLSKALIRSFAEECKPYLVRISAQHAWTSQAIDGIDLSSSVPIMIESANVLAGD